MQNTPNIDMVWSLDVENQMRIAGQWPSTQSRQIKFLRVTRRAGPRMAAEMNIGLLKRINKTERSLWRIFTQVVRNSLINIHVGLRPRDDRLGLHFRAPALAPLRTLFRRPSK